MISKGPVREITAEEFAARCLELLDEVSQTGRELVLTRNGRPMATVNATDEEFELREQVRKMITFVGDVESPIEDEWEADERNLG
jgi:antitoxin (DNA-binding transcriptional repressor) of toxin-antitoxin stability system